MNKTNNSLGSAKAENQRQIIPKQAMQECQNNIWSFFKSKRHTHTYIYRKREKAYLDEGGFLDRKRNWERENVKVREGGEGE